MRKPELVSAVAIAGGFTKPVARNAVDAVFGVICEELRKGNDVILTGYFEFKVKTKPAKAFDFHSGTVREYPAKKYVRVSTGKRLRDMVAGEVE